MKNNNEIKQEIDKYNLKERIKNMNENLNQSHHKLMCGEITQEQYLILSRDVTNRINEIRTELKKVEE